MKEKPGAPSLYGGEKMIDFHTQFPESHLSKLKKLSEDCRSRTHWLTQVIDREYAKQFSS